MKHLEIKPSVTENVKLIVMLHGVGSDGNDLISLAPFIKDSLPNCHFFSPDGVEPYDMAPFGRQWFSLLDRTPSIIMNLVLQNTPKINKIIQDKQLELGIDNSNTILLGFSQGAMIATYLTLIAHKPYAAMISFSGRLIPPDIINNHSTAFCIIHGEDDDILPCIESHNMAKYCADHKIKHQILTIPNLVHSIDAKAIEFAIQFLKDIVKI